MLNRTWSVVAVALLWCLFLVCRPASAGILVNQPPTTTSTINAVDYTPGIYYADPTYPGGDLMNDHLGIHFSYKTDLYFYGDEPLDVQYEVTNTGELHHEYYMVFGLSTQTGKTFDGLRIEIVSDIPGLDFDWSEDPDEVYGVDRILFNPWTYSDHLIPYHSAYKIEWLVSIGDAVDNGYGIYQMDIPNFGDPGDTYHFTLRYTLFVPEPASAVVLMLGGLTLLARRGFYRR